MNQIPPAQPVPDTNQQEHHREGERDRVRRVARTDAAHPHLGQRREDHVPHVEGEGHVPAIPVFPDAARDQRVVEVLGNAQAEQTGAADGQIAKAGEVAVQVEVVCEHGDDEIDHAMRMSVEK